MSQNSLLSVKEVAVIFGVERRTITRWVKAGHFPGAYKSGPGRTSRYRIPQSDVDALQKKLHERRGADASSENS